MPAAFATAVHDRLALDLRAAAGALMARLSDTAPAGCVAEEVISVSLIEEAHTALELRREESVVDQRIDAWFDAFAGTAPPG